MLKSMEQQMQSIAENEQINSNEQDPVSDSSRKWHSPLSCVTPFSKYFALVLFVVLPFVGFWLGTEWKNQQEHVTVDNSAPTILLETIDTMSQEDEIQETLITFRDNHVPFTFLYPEQWGTFVHSVPNIEGQYWKEVRLPSAQGGVAARVCTEDLDTWPGCNSSPGESWVNQNGITINVRSTSHKGNSWTFYTFNDSNEDTYFIQLIGPDAAVKGGDPYAPYDGNRDAWMRSKVPEYDKVLALVDSIQFESLDNGTNVYHDIEVSYYPTQEGPYENASDELSWSSWPGIVKDIFQKEGKYFVVVDRVSIYKGGGSCHSLDGICIVNENEDIIVLELDENTYLTLHWGCMDYENDLAYSAPLIKEDGIGVGMVCSIPFEASSVVRDDHTTYHWFDFDDAGRVVHIVEQYQP